MLCRCNKMQSYTSDLCLHESGWHMPQVDNGAGIGDNSEKISDDTAGIVDIATKVKSDPC